MTAQDSERVEELSQKIEEYFGNCDPLIIKLRVCKERADARSALAAGEGSVVGQSAAQ